MFQIKEARADLARIERESGGDLDLGGVILKLDEVIRRLTSRAD